MDRKNSQAKIEANNRYTQKTYEDIKVRVKKGQRDILQDYARAKGMSLNGYITSLIAADMGEKFTGEQA